MRQERRRHPRLEIPFETSLQLPGGEAELSVTMQDLSAGGAGLLTTTEIPIGTDVQRLRFDLPQGEGTDSEPVEVAGRVARCERQEGLGGEAEFLIGVQFVDITRELFDRIQKFVFQRLRDSQQERVQIERPIAIRFDRFDDFVDEVSVNLSTSGMFIRTRDPRPPGSVFNFQFQLGEDFSLIEGRAEVVWRRRHTEGPDKPPGMGVKFVNLDVPSQRLIDRLIAQRSEADSEAEVEPAEIEPEEAEVPAPEAHHETAEEHRATPPDLERAEASIVGLAQVNELRDAADRLRHELDEARRAHQQELQEVRARLEDRQAAASSELEERLRDAEAAHKESERQRRELAGKRDGLEAELDEARGEAEQLRRRLAESPPPAEVERLLGERQELQAARDGLEAGLNEARSEADDLRRQLAERTPEEEVRRLAGERDQLGAELEEARRQAEEREARLADRTPEEEVLRLTTEHGAFQATNTRLLADLDRANQEADELRQQLGDRAAEREIDRLAGERDELQAAHDEAQATQDALRADLGRARAEVDEARARFDSLESTRERLLADLDRVNEEADEMRRQLADRDRAETDLRGELEAAGSELENARNELEDARSEADRLNRSHEASLAQLEVDHSTALDKAVAEVREEAATRLHELGVEREQRDRLAAEAAREQQASTEKTAAELEAARQEATAAGERAAVVEAELEELRREIEEGRAAHAADGEESAAALAAAGEESERLRSLLEGAEQARQAVEYEMQEVRDQARAAARQAEEREIALRAEAENAALAATGGVPPPATEPRRGRRVMASAALLLVGALLGTLAVAFIRPLGSLADRLRPGGDDTVRTAQRPTAERPTIEPSAPAPLPVETRPAGPAAATPEPAAPQPAPPPAEPGPDPAAAEQAVRDWAAAWSAQRADDYLASYADAFQPPDGQGREAWAAVRRQRIERPRSIVVEVGNARTVELGPDRVSVSFDQTYTSDTYSDQVRKTQVLVWQEGAWKIAEERVIE